MDNMANEIENVIIYFETKYEKEKDSLNGEDKKYYKTMLDLLNNARVREIQQEKKNCSRKVV